MVFDDLVREEAFDVWIADEAWEVDHFLHENPERKTAPFAWLTDFVGFLPMPAGGEREAFVAADYNAEMIEHIERYPERPRPRDLRRRPRGRRSPARFGPGLPAIRDWTERHYDVRRLHPGLRPATIADRAALRAELGYGDEPLCVVSVGGSGVGAPLLHRAIEALPLARERVPGPADGGRRPARGSTRRACRTSTGSRSSATSTSCTGTSRPATSPSSRAA